jgi:hypothetical protein
MVNSYGFINGVRLLSANIMNQEILMIKTMKSMMYSLNDSLNVCLTSWIDIMTFWMSINWRMFASIQYPKIDKTSLLSIYLIFIWRPA